MPSFLLYLVLTAVCCVLTAPLMTLALLPAILWGVLLFNAGVRFGSRRTIFIFIFDILALYGTFGLQLSLFYILAIGMPALVMALMATEKKDFYQMRGVSLLMGFGGAALFYGYLMMTFGIDLGGLKDLFNQFTAMYADYAKSNSQLSVLYGGMSTEDLIAMIQSMSDTLFKLLPSILIVVMIIGNHFVLSFGSINALRHKADWVKKLPLAFEQLPWGITWILIAGLALFLLGYNAKDSVYWAGLNIIISMLPIGFYFGCAVLSGKYYTTDPKIRRIAVLILFIMCILSARMLLIFIALLGFLDSVANYRHIEKIEPRDN